MTHPVILILAAGASSRMGGRDKLLEEVAGRPLLRLVAERALASGAKTLVTLPEDRPARAEALLGLPLETVRVADANNGMSASLRAGLAALPRKATAAVILPADMPGITTEDLQLFLAAHAKMPEKLFRGSSAGGRHGHPALFPADLFPALMGLSGDEGGRSVLKANTHRLELIPLPGTHAVLDLDTPEDWAAYRASLATRPQ